MLPSWPCIHADIIAAYMKGIHIVTALPIPGLTKCSCAVSALGSRS